MKRLQPEFGRRHGLCQHLPYGLRFVKTVHIRSFIWDHISIPTYEGVREY